MTIRWIDHGPERPAIIANGGRTIVRILAELMDGNVLAAYVCEVDHGYRAPWWNEETQRHETVEAPTIAEAKTLALALYQLHRR